MAIEDSKIVEEISKYIKQNGYSPSVREICDAVGIASPGSMKYRLERLREKCLITYDDRRPRTIRVVG